MRVKEFVEGYENANAKENFIKNHVVKTYIPYEQKIAISKAIVKTAMTDKTNNFVRNTPYVYMNYVVSLVREYTDIEIEKGDALSIFNAIEEHNITNDLVTSIGNDAVRLDTVIKMVINDAIDNHCDIVNFLNVKKDAIALVLDELGKTVEVSQQS